LGNCYLDETLYLTRKVIYAVLILSIYA
jgi:hypothetical protein